jgi:U3 small nucleolar RNA-associated protein 19
VCLCIAFVQLFDTEVNRKIKKEPALVMELPKGFVSFPTSVMNTSRSEDEEEGDEQLELDVNTSLSQDVDVVGELWSFA